MAKQTQRKPATSNRSAKRSAKKKSGFFYQKILKVIALVCVVGLLVCAYVLSQSLWKDYPTDKKVQMLSVEKGQTYSKFIEQLAENDQVKFPIVLKLYQRLLINDTMKAGVYEVHQGASIASVLNMVSNAENAQMIRILVIEGTTFKQLKQQLKNNKYVKNTVLDQPNTQILKAIGATESHPEGLFAPDTYFYAKGETDLTILKDLYQRQQKILAEEWAKRSKDLPYANAYEALIMASIVEKETSVDAELEQVSGVFVRRLNIGMRLQTDPTVIYGMGDRYQGNIRRSDLTTPTPYNTYTINGLPPTPIALPSQKSIHAALHPDNGKAIYFVATGNGGHTFSTTLDEHNQAVKAYLAELRKQRN